MKIVSSEGHVTVTIRVPARPYADMCRMAAEVGQGPTAFARCAVFKAIGYKPHDAQAVRDRPRKCVSVPAPDGALEQKPTAINHRYRADATVIGLQRQGLGLQAIASVTKLPYGKICEILDAEALRLARKQGLESMA